MAKRVLEFIANFRVLLGDGATDTTALKADAAARVAAGEKNMRVGLVVSKPLPSLVHAMVKIDDEEAWLSSF